MPVSRRKFLQRGAFAAAALAAAPVPAWSSGHQPPAGANSPDGTTALSRNPGTDQVLSRQAFEQTVGSAFQVTSGAPNASPVWLTLISVKDLPALAPMNAGSMAVAPPKPFSSAVTTGFMLTFSSSAPALAQGVYTFQHGKLGQFPLLLVPGAPGLQTYMAVFNTLGAITITQPATPHGPAPSPLRPTTGTDGANNAVGSTGGRPAQ